MFKSTSEGEPRKHPSLYVQLHDESSSESDVTSDGTFAGQTFILGGDCTPQQITQIQTQTQPQTQQQTIIPQQVTPVVVQAPMPTPAPVPTPTPIQQTPPPPVPTQSVALISSLPSLCTSALVSPLVTAPLMVPPSPSGTPDIVPGIPASPSLTSTTSSMSPMSSLASPQHPLLPSPQATPGTGMTQTLFVTRTPLPHALTTPPQQNCAPGKDHSKNRKKSKGKMQPKARTIKFHEYKVSLKCIIFIWWPAGQNGKTI